MYVTSVPNRGSPPAVLLRESYRDGGKVKTRTLANLSHWPEHKVQTLKRALKGLPAAVDLSAAFEITRSLPHGHVAAVLGSARRLGVEELIDATPSRKRDLVTAMDWISALRAPQIKALVEEGALQLSLFDEQDLVEISSPEFPGERLVCCHNPVLAEQRTRKRQDLLVATEKDLTPIAAATGRERRPLRGKDNIALRVGKVINHYKMAKHFTLEITDESFTFTRNSEAIAAEAALDGIYVLRTSLPTDTLAEGDVVLRYKGLEDVERFFRTLNTRTRRPAHPAPASRPGPRPHVPAHAVLLPGLAHENRPGPNPFRRQRQTRRGRQTRQPRRRRPTLR